MAEVDVSPTTFKDRTDEFEKYAGWSGGTLDLDPNDHNRVFEFDVSEGEGVILGRGETANPLQAEAYMGAELRDDDSDADGTHELVSGHWQLVVRTANSGRFVERLASGDLEETQMFDSNGKKARDELKELPRTASDFATKEYIISFEVQPDAAVTVSDAPANGTTGVQIEGHHAERAN